MTSLSYTLFEYRAVDISELEQNKKKENKLDLSEWIGSTRVFKFPKKTVPRT